MIKFTKMQGLGNDYIYIDCIKNNLYVKDIPSLAQFVSNRHFGIGSDGLILLCKSDVADIKMRMFNADGTEAEMCGNGIRCIGKFAYDNKNVTKEEITVETLAGIKRLKLDIKNNMVNKVMVDMGEPILEPKKIPVISETNKITIKAEDRTFDFTCVSMGNPHAISVINNIDKFNLEKYGPILEINKHFPNRANIEFIEIINKNTIGLRVWERGTGETLACGTGACGAVVASVLNNLTQRNVEVELLGGNLNIEWNEEDNHVYMTGPAVTICEGEFEYDKN